MEQWDEEKAYLMANSGTIKVLGRDARMDSPGDTSKYDTYSLMDLDSNKVTSVQTIQVCHSLHWQIKLPCKI